MTTSAERLLMSSPSSHSMVGRSRWLVGSSRSRISGSGAMTRASAARRDSPPDSCAGVLVAGEAEMFQEIGDAVGIVAGAKAGLGIGAHAVETVEIGRLVQIADGGGGMAGRYRRTGVRQGRPPSSSGSICPSRCGRPGRCGRPAPPADWRRQAAACHRRTGRYYRVSKWVGAMVRLPKSLGDWQGSAPGRRKG